jgi:hypothetical protein
MAQASKSKMKLPNAMFEFVVAGDQEVSANMLFSTAVICKFDLVLGSG